MCGDEVFGPEPWPFFALIWSDYVAHYAYKHETERRRRWLCLPRLLTNASLHATTLVRFAHTGPRCLDWLWRRLLISWHSCDIPRSCTIGPGLQLPHPFGIAIGANVTVGRNAVIHHNVTFGPPTGRALPGDPLPNMVVGDDVVLFPGSVCLGALTIGDGAVVGANCLLTTDLDPGAVYVRDRLRGEETTRDD